MNRPITDYDHGFEEPRPKAYAGYEKARMRITRSTYRQRPGWLISGPDGHGHRVSVYTESWEAAVRCRDKLAAGEEITMADLTDEQRQ